MPRAGTASIGPDGGQVDAVLQGGVTVLLKVPKSALATAVNFRIEPLPTASGSSGNFRISPAGVFLKAPVTLSVTLPHSAAVPPNLALFLLSGDRRVPAGGPADPATRTLTAVLHHLGTGAEAAVSAQAAVARMRALAAGDVASVDAELAPAGFTEQLAILESFVNTLTQVEGRVAIAIDVQTVFGSILQVAGAVSDPAVRRNAVAWRDFVCAQRSFALSELNTYQGVAVVTFERLARDALIWSQLAQIMRGLITQLQPALEACSGMPDDYDVPVRERAAQFLENMRASLARIPADSEFDQLLNDRIPELLQLEAVFQRFALGSSAIALIADQTVRLRAAAYASCRTGDQTRQGRLLTLEIGDPAFLSASPFDAAALREDIQFCAVRLSWNLIDAASGSLASGTAGGRGVGSTRTSVPLVLGSATRIEINGLVDRLKCPSGALNDEIIGAFAGPPGGALTRVRAISPSDGGDYFSTGPASILLDGVRPLLGTNGSTAGGQIVLRRERGLCNGEFPSLTEHADLVRFDIVEPPAPPRVAGSYTGTKTHMSGGAFPSTAQVYQPADGSVILIRLDADPFFIGFELVPDGSLRFLGYANITVDRSVPVSWIPPGGFRHEATLAGGNLTVDEYGKRLSGEWVLDYRWTLTRR